MTLILICDMILVKMMMMLMIHYYFCTQGGNLAQFNLLQIKTVSYVLQTKNVSTKCICLILENMICRSFKLNVSFAIIQSTPFIVDIGGTLSQCPHQRGPVIAEVYFI